MSNLQNCGAVFLISRRICSTLNLNLVPKHSPVPEKDFEKLSEFVRGHEKLLIITGAGISTESGIPDYRSDEVGLYARSNHKPIQHQEFLRSASVRQRYWARNYVGWPRFSQRQPNSTHHAIRQLETINKLTGIVTQNVDNLHHKAGSEKIIELHGTSYRVRCLSCSHAIDRYAFQNALTHLNPHFNQEDQTKMIRPDGDVEIDQEIVQTFRVAACERCNGVMKPDIIFFGDNVPRERAESVKDSVEGSDSVLVLGSSLSTFSSYRIMLHAHEINLPVAIVNIGKTRADHLARLKLSGKCGEIMPRLCEALSSDVTPVR